MKAKYTLIALLALTFFGCDDNTGGLGLGMFPGSDQGINGRLTTFDVTTQSIPTGRIYAKTNVGYVGKFTDATFGTYEAGFLATLNCPEGLTFPDAYDPAIKYNSKSSAMVTDLTNVGLDEATKSKFRVVYATDANGNSTGTRIGNCQINLYLWYSSYFGDSLTACRMSIYELNKPLTDTNNEAYYTNIEPEKYYNTSGLLGAKAYTAVDMSVSDSIRKLDTYVPSVSLNFNQAITQKVGGRILTKAKELGNNLSKSFISDVFKGIYVKSDYGDGTVLYISDIRMDVASICYAFDDDGKILKSNKYAGKDSVVYSGRSFTATREVIQANRLTNDKVAIDDLIKKTDCTYLKSPAGIFTQAELPISEIGKTLNQDSLNAVKLVFSNYNQPSDKKFGMSVPTNVMLIRKKYKDSFFEKNQLANNTSSFLSSHTSSTNQYTFSNITKLINDCLADGEREAAIKELLAKGKITLNTTISDPTAPDGIRIEAKDVSTIEEWEKFSDWNKVVLIPVLVSYDNSNSYSSNVISVKHDLKPSYVKLKGGTVGEANKLKLEIVSTSFVTTAKN